MIQPVNKLPNFSDPNDGINRTLSLLESEVAEEKARRQDMEATVSRLKELAGLP